MIPKKLHYVWVGGKPIPKKIKEIMNRAKKVLGSDWTIKVWTEKEFDINSNPYTKYWHQKGQWSFVSDYIRAYAIQKEGGWYTDTDVWLSKTLDPLCKFDYVASRTYVVENTMSVVGAKKGHRILKDYLDLVCHPNLYKMPPKIMATDLHTYALRMHHDIPDENIDSFIGNTAVLRENILQIKTNDENIAIHEHHDNWKGTSDLNVSKYYHKKVKSFNESNQKLINKNIKKRNRMFKKIERLIK